MIVELFNGDVAVGFESRFRRDVEYRYLLFQRVAIYVENSCIVFGFT